MSGSTFGSQARTRPEPSRAAIRRPMGGSGSGLVSPCTGSLGAPCASGRVHGAELVVEDVKIAEAAIDVMRTMASVELGDGLERPCGSRATQHDVALHGGIARRAPAERHLAGKPAHDAQALGRIGTWGGAPGCDARGSRRDMSLRVEGAYAVRVGGAVPEAGLALGCRGLRRKVEAAVEQARLEAIHQHGHAHEGPGLGQRALDDVAGDLAGEHGVPRHRDLAQLAARRTDAGGPCQLRGRRVDEHGRRRRRMAAQGAPCTAEVERGARAAGDEE